MKEIIERKLKELNTSYDFWLGEIDEHDDEWIEDRLHSIRSKISILEEVLEDASKNNSK